MEIDEIFASGKYQNWLDEMTHCIELSASDEEMAHIIADNILCEIVKELLGDKIPDAFEEVAKWYS